ncbi:MAG: type II toxin-antitoxin system VapC family toxin [Gammaproteobacteria bacterium]
MIVVDTNTIAYLYLPTENSGRVEELLKVDPIWTAPFLWRSELRNILCLYLRKELLDFETAASIQNQAESLLRNNEYGVNSVAVLSLAQASNCSAYDCEFVYLAKALNTKLITADKKLIKAFPDIAMRADEYIASLS